LELADHGAEGVDFAFVGGFLAFGFLEQFEEFIEGLAGLAQGAEGFLDLLHGGADGGGCGGAEGGWIIGRRGSRGRGRWAGGLAPGGFGFLGEHGFVGGREERFLAAALFGGRRGFGGPGVVVRRAVVETVLGKGWLGLVFGRRHGLGGELRGVGAFRGAPGARGGGVLRGGLGAAPTAACAPAGTAAGAGGRRGVRAGSGIWPGGRSGVGRHVTPGD
jgi:hypothetical protein